MNKTKKNLSTPSRAIRRAAFESQLAEAAAAQAEVAGYCSYIRPCQFPAGSVEAIRYPAIGCGAVILRGSAACVAGHAQ